MAREDVRPFGRTRPCGRQSVCDAELKKSAHPQMLAEGSFEPVAPEEVRYGPEVDELQCQACVSRWPFSGRRSG